jgi:outer membrane protein
MRNRQLWVAPVVLLAATVLGRAQGAAPTKLGIIHIQNAIVTTKEGQKSAAELDVRVVSPKRKELERKQSEIQGLQAQLQKGGSVLSEDQKTKLVRDIDAKTKSFNRDAEDANAEIEQEQGKVLQELGGKMMGVIDKYAKEKGFAVILDVSQRDTNVLYAANEVDITKDIVELYDKAYPSAGAPAGAAPTGPAKPLTPPVIPAPKKK